MTKEEKKEYMRQYSKQYYQENREEILREERWHSQRHKERIVRQKEQRERQRKHQHEYYLSHREERLAYGKYWRDSNSDKTREERKRSRSKSRGLGYIPINKYFRGSHFHHLDKDIGVYIPEWLHMAYPHNLWTEKGMDKINAAALYWWMLSRCKESI